MSTPLGSHPMAATSVVLATPPASGAAPRRVRSLLAPLTMAMILAGCASAPTPLQPHAGVSVPEAFSAPAVQVGAQGWTVAPPAEAAPRGAWWLPFADPVLSGLVERADAASPTVQRAAAQVAQARALLRSADAARSVQVGVNAGAMRQAGLTTTGGTTPTTVTSASLAASYEVDLMGRLAGESDAARLDAQAQSALLQSARLLVQADVVQTYLQLRASQSGLALVEQGLEAYRESLRLTERRLAAGDVAELDLARLQAEVSATEAESLALRRQQALLTHALAALVGEPATGFAVPAAPLAVTALPVIPAGVPSAVLARRPDVAAAQASVLAAQARVGVAQAAWFPSLTLTGSAGHASPELSDLFQWSARAWTVNALLSLPLWDGGRRQAQVQGAEARLQAAVADQRAQVLQAFREVEDQLASLQWLQGQAQAQQQAVTAARKATRLSDVRYRNGLVSQLELLDARRTELRNERQALQVRSAQFQGTVALIRALGGGWGADATGVAATPVAQLR